MNVIPPLACLAVGAIMFATQTGLLKASGRQIAWRESILSVAVVWGVVIWAVTELLGLFHQINFLWIASVWALAALGTAAAGLARRRALASQVQVAAQRWRGLSLGWSEKLIALATLLSLVCLVLIA